jgi:hypothetical protein
MKTRKLRIAWSVGALVVLLALPALQPASDGDEMLEALRQLWFNAYWDHRWEVTVGLLLIAIGPWLPWPNRFSLRTLLIVTTLVALVLGLIVAVLRLPAG